MSTLAIKQLSRRALGSTDTYSVGSILSFSFALLFIAYLIVPRIGILNSVHHLGVSLVFVILMPIASFILALYSLRHHQVFQNRELIMSYSALAITSLYFITILAIPVVLIGYYFLYSYIL
jgi:hypothetical protein